MVKTARRIIRVGSDEGISAPKGGKGSQSEATTSQAALLRRQVLKRFSATEINRVAGSFDSAFFVRRYGETLGLNSEDFKAALLAYLENVVERQLNPNPDFNEAGYLQRNLDVAEAVRGGELICGFHHWLVYGQKEGRKGGEMFKRSPTIRPKPLTEINRPRPLASLTPEETVAILVESGAVKVEDYLAKYPDLGKSGVDPLLHYVQWGHKEGRVIHDLFDYDFYLKRYPEVASSGVFPLVEYLFEGAAKGRQSHPYYDTVDYAKRYNIDLATSNPLIHYTLNNKRGISISIPHFDEKFYRETYPEVSQYRDGAFLHFFRHGVYEGRRPNPDFNPRYYYSKHLNNDYSINAFQHYIDHGLALGLETDFPKHVPTVSREIRFFANQGPHFEELDINLAKGRAKRAKLLAFYLPQFHAFPENDAWWGTGFTEWRNIPRGVPRFAGHYQPRIPRDLSYYDLTDHSVMKRQVEMALDMGLSGFCFYFYWFDRHRLMEGPLDRFVADKSLNMPFMILWANENWTRRWDGMEAEVLIKQHQREEDDVALVDCFQSYFMDARYIRIGERPLLVIYRADILKDSKATLKKWRELFRERHNEEPLIFLAQAFKAEDPDAYGFDGAIEFPPHKLGNMIKPINDQLHILDWDFSGQVFDYESAVNASLSEEHPSFPHIKTVFPSWDNNARRQTSGAVYHGSTPALFGRWIDGVIEYSKKNPVGGESIVFLNAWNEWCEGAYLEPDIHFGGAMLNALARTVSAGTPELAGDKFRLLLVGHDAFPAGAQLNLLEMAKTLQRRFGIEVHVILLGDGALLPFYEQAVPTTVCDDATIGVKLEELHARGFRFALTNTTGAASVVGVLKQLEYAVASLVHELPQIIRTNLMEYCAEILRENADTVIFASAFVQDAFVEAFGPIKGDVLIQPQGIYKFFERDDRQRSAIRQELGLPEDSTIILNVAYGDLRKGVDLFCQAAQAASDKDPNLHFVWVGGVHPWAEEWILSDIQRQGIKNVHFVGQQDDVARWMNSADLFFLTSREDPFPSVVLEALQVGLPILGFEGNGGFVDLIGPDPKLGKLVRQGDIKAIHTAIRELVGDVDSTEYRIAIAREKFDFADYLFDLLKLFRPDLKKVSVVVPNYNYERYIRARVNTIFEQTYPIYETIVLDDCSTDRSIDEITRTISDGKREVTLVKGDENSGSVFKQWKKALDMAKGELLWIAEADDLAEPVLMERLALHHAELEKCIFAFADSRSIDENGFPVYDSYIPYAEGISPGALCSDRIFEAREFAEKVLGVANLVLNGSSVLWNKEKLARAFEQANSELSSVKLVGDWLIYLSACEQGGQIAYDAVPANIHRRHSKSVTHALDKERHLDEIKKMHLRASKVIGKRVLSNARKKYLEDVDAWLAG